MKKVDYQYKGNVFKLRLQKATTTNCCANKTIAKHIRQTKQTKMKISYCVYTIAIR